MKIKRGVVFLNNWCKDRFYGKRGKGSKIIKPMRILGKSHIFIGNNVLVLNLARLEAVNGTWGEKKYEGKLVIGDGTSIEQNCHIVAAGELVIGCNCVLSSNVYISDCNHKYAVDKPIMEQDLEVRKTTIGNGTFIGVGAKIMPGVNIGKHCIVGANAVVTKNIEDYSMVAGVPARIIKKYDENSKQWTDFRESRDEKCVTS